MGGMRVAILIAGPTASGKSALALALAERLGGAVINADSMQVYRDLKIITARPRAAEEARAPHRLYGHVDAAENYSVGRFVQEASAALAQADRDGRVAIVTGGTGLYFKALTTGLAAIPPIPPDIRATIRARFTSPQAGDLHAELTHRDPVTARRLSPADRPRISRALEVLEATGRSISDWHRDALPPPLDPSRVMKIFLTPDRAMLYRRIDARFDAMLPAGAIEEVQALAARQLDPLLPAMKAHGVPWLMRHLAGEVSLAAAIVEAKKDTRHYAKRQFTWFRHQLGDWPAIAPQDAFDSLMRAQERFIPAQA
jgi:tRNA dimethylallyltransferase